MLTTSSSSSNPDPDPIPKSTHLTYLSQTITLAKRSPPKPTNFRVGAVIVSYTFPSSPSPLPSLSQSQSQSQSHLHSNDNPNNDPNPDPNPGPQSQVLSTGYTLELPGNTHAEQNALHKLLPNTTSTSTTSTDTTSPNTRIYLYTSLEPCSVRLSGNESCVTRILKSQHPKIDRVIFGAKEPGTFVRDSKSCQILSAGGVEWSYVADYEGDILRVAMEGHERKEQTSKEEGDHPNDKERKDENPRNETRIWDITEEERKRQEAQPRNPKKRAMDTSLPQQGA